MVDAEIYKRLRFHSFFGYLIGLPNIVYKGFVTGINQIKYDGAFVTHPELIVMRSHYGNLFKIVKYKPKKNIKLLSNVALFVDQPLEHIFTINDLCKINLKLNNFIDSIDKKVYFKIHYDSKNTVENNKFTILSNSYRTMPVELLIEEIKPSIVISYFSSALMNIKKMYPQIKCISIGANLRKIQINGKNKNFADLIAQFDIENIRV